MGKNPDVIEATHMVLQAFRCLVWVKRVRR